MKTFHKAPLALAIAALMVAPYAMAQQAGQNDFETDSEIDSEFNNDIDVELNHDSDTYKNFYTNVWTWKRADNYSGATVDSKQLINGNDVDNDISTNTASVGNDAMNGASGNIGANVAAGDNNQQANDAALAASDAADVFGQAAAFSAQSASYNGVTNSGSPNNASLDGNALNGATGNIGINVAAGNMNAQQNSLAAASNTMSGSADATAGGVQSTYGNTTNNTGTTRHEYNVVGVTMRGGMGGTYRGGGSGTYAGTWEQTNNVYPEVWQGGTQAGGHPNAPTYWGHLDFDDADDQANNSQFAGEEGGTLGFREAGRVGLSGVFSGQVVTRHTVYVANENNATLGGNSLNGASGNIGVNIAAGTNNLQRNSLSIASSVGGGANNGGGNGGG